MMLGAVKNNPGFQSDEALVDGFVVRQQAFRRALKTLAYALEHPNDPRKHHLLLVGRRGMGKTTLSLRLAAELRRCPKLSALALPIVFPEESYEIASMGELALSALRHYAHQTRDSAVQERVDALECTLHEQGELAELALSELEAIASARRVNLVLVVENLDMLLDEQLGKDAVAQLARMLERHPWLTLIASAVAGIPATEQPTSPLFDRFQVVRLQPLSVADCRTLWHANHSPGALAVDVSQPLVGDRIRPIHILTGGSPRLLKIIAAAAPGRSLADLMDELLLFVDEHTSFFKSMLESLPPVERRVFAALADLWEPASAREVAGRARLDVNRTSSLLHRLAGRGAAEVTRIVGRSKTYQVADRSYNLYHLLRRGGPQADRLQALVAFMVHFYTGEAVRPLDEAGDGTPLDALRSRAARGDWESTLTNLVQVLEPCVLDDHRLRPDAPLAEVSELLTSAVARGHGETVEVVLARSPAWQVAMEPLLIAIRWLAKDEEPDAPQEVRAVALDVLSTISARR